VFFTALNSAALTFAAHSADTFTTHVRTRTFSMRMSMSI
jgi:hypothetical protein